MQARRLGLQGLGTSRYASTRQRHEAQGVPAHGTLIFFWHVGETVYHRRECGDAWCSTSMHR